MPPETQTAAAANKKKILSGLEYFLNYWFCYNKHLISFPYPRCLPWTLTLTQNLKKSLRSGGVHHFSLVSNKASQQKSCSIHFWAPFPSVLKKGIWRIKTKEDRRPASRHANWPYLCSSSKLEGQIPPPSIRKSDATFPWQAFPLYLYKGTSHSHPPSYAQPQVPIDFLLDFYDELRLFLFTCEIVFVCLPRCIVCFKRAEQRLACLMLT